MIGVGPECTFTADPTATITATADHFNLDDDGTCQDATTSGSVFVSSLAYDGGATPTMRLQAGSSAIDAGDDAVCAAAPVSGASQNGVARPQHVHCDVGAYEAPYTRVDRVTNGGLDVYSGRSKAPKGWVKGHFAATDGKDTKFHKDGAASVRITGARKKTKTLTQTVALAGVAGDRFTFGFWARGASIPKAGTCRAQVLLYNGTALKLTKTVSCKTGTYRSFQNKTLTFNATSAFTKAVIRFTYAKAEGTVWFDAVSLIE